uniref:Uncharacterized protein n=1 Tax=Rhizophora mucronata TaxID=61149 RepID=A0A2P2QCI7_RHIMU
MTMEVFIASTGSSTQDSRFCEQRFLIFW